ncbi:protein SAR DEFICIENT 1-like [Zingiber officinale]|uniref:protein SAR DEFICIENT 1-like n=1 Tax=Zingiber officinale TaxID=94328 RepID=UPI001C4C90D8|nr:protein SAR DEFICIENT 1-like [Zingiber officinale]
MQKNSTTNNLEEPAVGLTSSMQKYVSSALEPMLRRVVREEVERRLIDSMKKELHRSPRMEPSPIIGLMQLSFTKPLSLSIYTKASIKDRDNNTLQIQLVPHESSGPINIMPHLEVEIVVLDGDFPGGVDADWTSEDFESHIVKERKGKRPLLVGDCKVTILQGSPASVHKLEFTDNSSWVRSRHFRLGARVISPESYQGPIRIKEAITDRFTVLDHRGELNKKHHPPSLDDRVWRLKNIGKNGIFDKRLADAGIRTVQDLLKLSMLDMQRLRQIMGGGHGMSDSTWEATISHARCCEMGKEVYLYHGQILTLVLSPIGEVKGAVVNGWVYPLQQLPHQYMLIVERLVHEAYSNWDKLEKVDETSLANAIAL